MNHSIEGLRYFVPTTNRILVSARWDLLAA